MISSHGNPYMERQTGPISIYDGSKKRWWSVKKFSPELTLEKRKKKKSTFVNWCFKSYRFNLQFRNPKKTNNLKFIVFVK